MEFDDPHCLCPDLVDAARLVLQKIPEKDRHRIERVCNRVIFVQDGNTEAEYFPDESEMRVVVPRMRDFSAQGQRGIFAHEFGHAFDISARDPRAGNIAEKMADANAQRWGFYAEVKARERDSARLRQG